MGHAIDEGLSSLIVNSNIGGRAGGRVITVHQIERRVSGADMNPVIVRELRNGQPIDPIVLLVIDKEVQVLFEFLIDPFDPTVSLRMICRGRIILDAK